MAWLASCPQPWNLGTLFLTFPWPWLPVSAWLLADFASMVSHVHLLTLPQPGFKPVYFTVCHISPLKAELSPCHSLAETLLVPLFKMAEQTACWRPVWEASGLSTRTAACIPWIPDSWTLGDGTGDRRFWGFSSLFLEVRLSLSNTFYPT